MNIHETIGKIADMQYYINELQSLSGLESSPLIEHLEEEIRYLELYLKHLYELRDELGDTDKRKGAA